MLTTSPFSSKVKPTSPRRLPSAAGSTQVPTMEGREHEAKARPINPHKAMIIKFLFISYSFLIWSGKDTTF
jgi:hypothetical protein